MKRSTDDRKLHIAVIGSGPAGLYTTAELLRCFAAVQVDIFEKLSTPFGLLRYGVSPDHTRTRKICSRLAPVLEDPRVRFLGNVEVSDEFSLDLLRPYYHATVIASGAEVDRSLTIPGADLPGCHTSLEFIGWINGHPEFAEHPVSLSAESVVVIGNGNVALDVVRLLLKPPGELTDTDINPLALEALGRSRVRDIHIVGRRGPAQAAFRTAELQEIAELDACSFDLRETDLQLNAESEAELALEDAEASTHKQVVEIFRDIAKLPEINRPKRLSFRFLERATSVEGDGKVEQVVFAKCRLTGPPGRQTLEPTGERDPLPCGLIVQCIGHHGTPLKGAPFDEKSGTVPTRKGRVISESQPVPGLYAAGWIDRGATGLIGHSKRDAKSAVDAIREDAGQLARPEDIDIDALLRRQSMMPVSYPGLAPGASA